MAKFLQVAPSFAARDVAALVAFYGRAMELMPIYQSPEYAVLARDGVELHIYPQRDGAVAGNNSAYFYVSGVDEIFERVKAEAKVIHAIGDKPYGLRDFLFEDPEGNKVGVAQSLG